MRFAIEKKNNNLHPLYTFNLLNEGHTLLRKLCQQFQLCAKLCFLQSPAIKCIGIEENKCLGACEHKESPEEYNKRVMLCIDHLSRDLPTFALLDNGILHQEQSCILMEKGRFYGMGYLPVGITGSTIEELKFYLTPYSENDYIRGLVYQYASKFPDKKKVLMS